ncbi:MAG TPA: barstar family protein [Candidatus Saccharimonadales bacterium]|nr:barstar family protein [Candidatus Saccharimonadales bacterium]
MQIQQAEIMELATPFLVLECQGRDLEALALNARSHSNVARTLRGSKCRTKQAFFDEIAAAFQFPSYFGENWDAFSECMNDLTDWLPADSYLLFISDADQLLSAEPYKEFETLMGILNRTASRWKTGSNHARFTRATKGDEEIKEIGFAVVLQHAPETEPTGNFKAWLEETDTQRLVRSK